MANVVIVEDNLEIASLYELVFEKHQTNVFNDLPEAMVYLQEARPDLVIVDFHLPSGSGVDVLSFMRAQPNLKDVPVLGISVDDTLKYEAQEHGANAFLTKPIDIGELINTAQKLITNTQRPPNHEMRAILNDYAAAYQAVYSRPPKGTWTGTSVLIDGQECDGAWLRSETQRLRSLTVGGQPKNYLLRLIDKLRRV